MLGVLVAALGLSSCGVPLSCPQVCEILVLQPGMEPETPALQGGFLNIGSPEKSPAQILKTH